MKRTKKTFSDISVFYPENVDEDYVEGVDYNSKIFDSPFTSELSKIYSNYIFEELGEKSGKVLAWSIQIKHIPLLIEIISREDVVFIFLFTKDKECSDMISAVLTLLKLASKCNITKSSSISIEMDGIIYIGIDEIPIRETKRKIAAIVLIDVETSTKLLKIKNMDIVSEDFKGVEIFVQTNEKKISYPSEEEYSEYTTIEDDYKRPKNKKKEISKFLEQEKADIGEIKKSNIEKKKSSEKSKWFSQTIEPEEEEEEEEEEQKIQVKLKGDKYQNIKRVDLTKAHKNHPKKGGWIQVDNGVQNFYLFGTGELSSPPISINKDSHRYKGLLIKYIMELINIFTPFDFDVKLLVTDKYLDLWLQTWTHESFDINNNYETLETVGDTYFGACFETLMYKKYPDITRAELTFLKNNIGSKPSLRQVGWQLNMDQWLRMGEGAVSNTNTAEDIVEAFCATLQIVTNDVLDKLQTGKNNKDINIGPGAGIIMVQAFVEYLFGTVVITDEMFLGSSKTVLNQSVQGIGGSDLEHPAIIENYVNGSKTKTHLHVIDLYWSPEALAFFKENDYPMKRAIAHAEGTSKKAIVDQVYTLAIQNLKKEGYSINFFRDLKNQLQMSIFDSQLVKAVINKARKQLKDPKATIKFYIPRTLNTVNSVTVILRGVVDDGTRNGQIAELAQETNKSGDTNVAKEAVLRKYIEKK